MTNKEILNKAIDEIIYIFKGIKKTTFDLPCECKMLDDRCRNCQHIDYIEILLGEKFSTIKICGLYEKMENYIYHFMNLDYVKSKEDENNFKKLLSKPCKIKKQHTEIDELPF